MKPSEELTGEILESLRIERGLKQKELAPLLNIDSSTISSYENGKIFPSVTMISEIADFYDTSVDFLLGKTKIRAKPEKIESDLTGIDVNVLSSLSEGHKKIIAELIHAYQVIEKLEKKS